MKKTVLAAAILSLTTGAAMAAGNSLQVYGKIDLSAESINNGTSTTTALTSGNSATSRLGFKGTEDLGGGLMGMFVLESGIKPDTGTSGDGARFFDRSAWVGLKGNFGTLRLGRMDSLLGQTTGNASVLGNQNFDDFKIGGMEGSATNRRIDNAIAYALPTMVEGLKAEVQYSLAPGGAATGTEGGAPKQYGLSVGYKVGGFNAGVASLINRVDVNNKQGGTLAHASYDFGMLQLIGYYQIDQQKVAGAGSNKRKLMGLHVNAPIGANTKLLASVGQVRNVRFVKDAKANIITLEANYSLSKRTYLYGMFTNVSNKGGALAGIGGDNKGTVNESARGLAAGIVHSF